MNDSNALPAFLTGVLLTMVFFVLLDSLPGSYRSLAVTALEECEKTLPRNQHCVVTAIPEEIGKSD